MSKLLNAELERIILSYELGIKSCDMQEEALLKELESCRSDRKKYLQDRRTVRKLLLVVPIAVGD